MKTLTLRGVPLCMQQDGWWLDLPPQDGLTKDGPPKDGPQKDGQAPETGRSDWARTGLLLAFIALGDVLVWQVTPGLSLALFFLALWGTGIVVAGARLTRRTRIVASAGAVLAVLPLVELVQPLSLGIAVTCGTLLGAALAGLGAREILRGGLRIWWVAPAQTARDAAEAVRAGPLAHRSRFDPGAFVRAWALPVLATCAFAVLLVGANPVLDQWLSDLDTLSLPAPDAPRLWFWGALAVLVWPVLTAGRLCHRLRVRAPARATVRAQGLVNPASVARSLVAFNALFAVQTGMDVLFLYAQTGLPEGISPAAYAHRGAYPLVGAALLAGLFAVLARPYLANRPLLRVLLLVWLVQTLALVFASVWRLDAYVAAFGLTRLRLAAYIWMALVAAGLTLVMWQVFRDRPAAWMLLRAGGLGAVVLYGCAFVSFDAAVARHNLTRPVPQDMVLLCQMSEAVVPALAAHFGPDWRGQCASTAPRVRVSEDWREWGFRNWRVRRSLARTMSNATAP